MDTLHPYAKTEEGGFEAIALQAHNIVIHHIEGVYYRRVDFYEPIGPFQIINLGALAVGAVSALTQLTNLDMPDDELGQFRWYILDNAQVRLMLPSGIQKGVLKFIQSIFDMNTPLRDPNLVSTEIFVWEDNRPAVQATNGMSYALNAIRIIAAGYRFHTVDLVAGAYANSIAVSKIKAGTEPATHVWTSGRGQG